MASGVWYPPGHLTKPQQIECIRRYTHEAWEYNPHVTHGEVLQGLHSDRPRGVEGRNRAQNRMLVKQQLRWSDRGISWGELPPRKAPSRPRAPRTPKVTSVVRRQLFKLYQGLCIFSTVWL